MANNTITFNPESGVPYGVNLTIYQKSTFRSTFQVNQENRSAFNLTGYSITSKLKKSVAIGATLGASATFTVGFTSAADGKMKISLGSTSTRDLSQGRYGYTVLVSSGSTLYNLVNGQIYVYPGIASAP